MYNNRKGLFGSAITPQGPTTLPSAPMPDMQQPQAKANQGPSTTRRIAGILGDAMLGYAGQRGVYGPMMAQRQMLDEQRGFAVQQGKIQREQDQQDWYARQEYERANPEPADPYRWRSNSGDLMEIGGDGTPRVAYTDPTARINWVQVRDPATGAITLMPMGPNGPMSGTEPNGNLPTFTEDDWNNAGGAGGNPSGTFRR
jgi:hypothetical protein